MSQIPRGRPEGGRFGFGRLLLAITLSAIWFFALRPAVDPDYGWHIQNGRHVIDGTVFGGRDLYSWTAGGYWIVHEWLVEAAMSLVHDSLGAPANSILAALLTTIAFLLVAKRLRDREFGWACTLATIVLGFFCTMMSVGVRPQVLELAYLAVLLLIVDRWIENEWSAGRLRVAVFGLAVLWVNTHGSFPLMTALLGLAAAGALAEKSEKWRGLAWSAAISAAAALINPWGWRIYGFATQSFTSKPTLTLIEEWKPPQLATGSLIPFDIAVTLAGIAAIALLWRLRSPRSRGMPARLDDVAVFIGLLYLGMTSGRHVMLFGIGAAPLIAWTIRRADTLFRSRAGVRRRVILSEDLDTKAAYAINRAAALTVAIGLAFAGWGIVNPAAQRAAIARRYPVGVVDELRELSRPPARMFNEYAWGGFLIANGITPVFIDGRSELYGDEQLLRYGRIIRLSSGWRETLDSLGVTVAVVPRDSKLMSILPRIGWESVASDSVGVVLKRR